MAALEPPAAVVGQARATQQDDVIEIVGNRADQALKIDRRTYRVQQTAHSTQKDAIQLLRGLPAVTISPDDQVNLLGAPNVTILIDGHQSRTDLHTLHGTDIERIEIITNPSAQYSAEGTGGIINIILRKKQGEGLSGNANFEASSFGRGMADATAKLKRGNWTYEVETQGGSGEYAYSTYHKLRTVEPDLGGAPTINTENGGGPQRSHWGWLRAKVTYDIDPKTSLSAESYLGGRRATAINRANFLGVTPDFPPFSERVENRDWGSFATGLLTFDHKGSHEGETLKASIWFFGNPVHRVDIPTQLSSGDSLSSEFREGSLWGQNKIDWEHPIGKKQILSAGAEWDLQQIHHRYRFTSSDPSAGADASDEYRGSDSTVAAYATFQQQIGTWTIMPGLRIEQNGRHISTPGSSDVRINRTNAFPTFHAEHALSKALQLTVSYSKRIDRPQFDMLRPFRVVEDVLTIAAGNPALRDQSTDSYEVNLHFHRRKVEAGVIIYNRYTNDVWSQSYVINPSGQNLYTWVNAGQQRDRGAEVDLSIPILRRVKVVSSINFFDARVPIYPASGQITDERFRFTTNSTLEWDGPDRKRSPGDIMQLVWAYQSPARTFQLSTFAWNSLSLSYTHSFSHDLSLTATAGSGIIHNGHRLTAPLLQEYYRVYSRPELKLKLMRTFGKH